MPSMNRTPVYLGTVLLEANRWTPEKRPSFRVSDWLARSAEAGFDGLELWENHAALAAAPERAALRSPPLPVRVFNSYATLDDAGAAARQRAVDLVRELRAPAVKFNFGRQPGDVACELRNARAWAAALPGVRFLCECHPGTALEAPGDAARVLADWPEAGVIVHPFTCADLGAWFRHLGARICHAHVQLLDSGRQRRRLEEQPGHVRERLDAMRAAGYAGSFTIEFTAGVNVAPEDHDALFAAACADLAFLRRAWDVPPASGPVLTS
jgi:sugar phosphate isomerase/epimerase